MLTIIIKTLAQILLIFVMFTAILLLIACAFATISGIKDVYEQNKIKSENLRQLQKDFNQMLDELNKKDL